MNKKMIILFCAGILALGAIIAGFCFFFLGNKIIESIPKYVSVEKIDDDFYVVSDYNGEYGYQFKLEQMIGENFVLVDTVDSNVNMLKLSDTKMDIVVGELYRFSACYTTENGAGNGKFSDPVEWTASWNLDALDYDSVVFDDEKNVLSWDPIYSAEEYVLKFVDEKANEIQLVAHQENFSVDEIPVGNYKVFIVGRASNRYLKDSFAGEGFDLSIVRENVINQVLRDGYSLNIVSTEKVENFEIFADGVLKATLTVENVQNLGDMFAYSFDNLKILFDQLDFETMSIQIKSLQCGNVLESALSQIN